MSKIAFYATIKPPDHPIASGDRLIARNLIAALKIAGYDVELASSFIAYSKREAKEILLQRKADAHGEAKAIIERLKPSPPDLWITYHPYCKAPDWIGPIVSAALGIPYVTIEAARTGQGFEDGGDRWVHWRQEAQTGIRKADLHLAFKPTDQAFLTELLGTHEHIAMIAPFIDTTPPEHLPDVQFPNHWRPGVPKMIATGMMRPGKKVKNFQLIADALLRLQALHWNLLIIGGGPEEETVRAMFEPLDQQRIEFTGIVPHEEVLAYMRRGDLFVWPGWKEPIGMVYLEAQLMGLPVAALDSMGVSLSVHHGKTGLLAAEDDRQGFADNLATLLSHPSLRRDFGQAAMRSVTVSHSLPAAANSLRAKLDPLMKNGAGRRHSQ